MGINYEVIETLERIAREKGVERDYVIQTLKDGLLQAAKKKFGSAENISVDVDLQSGEISMWARKRVVDEVYNPESEINLEDAKKLSKKAEIGGEVSVEIPFNAFGRLAIQAAKQVLLQKVREAERERIFVDFSDKIGEIVTGAVQHIDRGDIIINLSRAEAILPTKEQIRSERYKQGDTIKACVISLQKTSRGPQIIVSRAHPDFLKKLFYFEVPEIQEGLIEIKGVAREPGERAKIAVLSRNDKIDPVGSCVGLKGCRVQAIVRELSGERIDIVPYSIDPATFVHRALQPAKNLKIFIKEKEKRMIVVAPEDQLSLAIGKRGQNARLAAKLTGWGIDILDEAEYKRREEVEKELLIPVVKLELSKNIKEKLITAGIMTSKDIVDGGIEALTKIKGIGKKKAEKIFGLAEIALKEAEEAKHIEEQEESNSELSSDEEVEDKGDEIIGEEQD